MINKFTILFILFFISTGCSSKKNIILFNNYDSNQTNKGIKLDKIKFTYKIVPHDRISLSTYKQPDLTTINGQNPSQERGILVNSEGYIRIPLVRDIKVAGLTQREASNKIESRLREYIKYPEVSLEVINKRAYIIGEVNKPGEIPLNNEKLSLIKMIAKAGDLTNYANRSSILVLKTYNGKVVPKIIDLTNINSIKMINFTIQPNDIVYVMPNNMKSFNVGLQQTTPILNVVSNILRTFINIEYLSK